MNLSRRIFRPLLNDFSLFFLTYSVSFFPGCHYPLTIFCMLYFLYIFITWIFESVLEIMLLFLIPFSRNFPNFSIFNFCKNLTWLSSKCKQLIHLQISFISFHSKYNAMLILVNIILKLILSYISVDTLPVPADAKLPISMLLSPFPVQRLKLDCQNFDLKLFILVQKNCWGLFYTFFWAPKGL